MRMRAQMVFLAVEQHLTAAAMAAIVREDAAFGAQLAQNHYYTTLRAPLALYSRGKTCPCQAYPPGKNVNCTHTWLLFIQGCRLEVAQFF